MRRLGTDPVVIALRSPATVIAWSLPQWEALIRDARRANLLSRVALTIAEAGLLPRIPQAPRTHLEAARTLAQAQADSVRREVAYIDRALAATGFPIVLLKGAAYLLAELPAARGRLFSDIDILVPRSALANVEGTLMLHGWQTSKTDPYDQRYYRRWMHELPPLKHNSRQTILDVHHAILPTTARLKPDSRKLLAAARPLKGEPRLRVLAPTDMVLHSATHLFCNEDVGNNLRDLVDVDSLLRSFAQEGTFWPELTSRAVELGLARPLYYALRYAVQILGTPVPRGVLGAAESGRPLYVTRSLMDALFLRTLQANATNERLASMARGSLYVRAHWLRMPPLLLVQHLAVKALRGESERVE
ncbi:MAG TPA: nucleotidyltransferase family protein [Casimicrobiaceae bacterium]